MIKESIYQQANRNNRLACIVFCSFSINAVASR